MSLPSGISTAQDQGTADRSLPATVARLTEVARVAYQDERFRDRYPHLDDRALNPDTWFIAVLSHVRAYDPYTGVRTRAYLADLHTLMAAVENTAYLWLNRELTSQVRHLEKLRTELFANLKPLCEVAGAYVKLRDSMPKETQRRHVASAKVMVPATETPRSWREREEQARIQLSNPWIDVLFRHPRRYALFNALAQ